MDKTLASFLKIQRQILLFWSRKERWKRERMRAESLMRKGRECQLREGHVNWKLFSVQDSHDIAQTRKRWVGADLTSSDYQACKTLPLAPASMKASLSEQWALCQVDTQQLTSVPTQRLGFHPSDVPHRNTFATSQRMRSARIPSRVAMDHKKSSHLLFSNTYKNNNNKIWSKFSLSKEANKYIPLKVLEMEQ